MPGARRLGAAPQLMPFVSPQVFQRREDGSVNFFRGWEAYRDGFGKLTGEHWLGVWGWLCSILGRLAKSGLPCGGLGFPLRWRGHGDPPGQHPCPGSDGLGRHGGDGVAAEGKEAMGLLAPELSTCPWAVQPERGVESGNCSLSHPAPPPRGPLATPSPRGPHTHPFPSARAEEDPPADGAGQLRAPHRPGGL